MDKEGQPVTKAELMEALRDFRAELRAELRLDFESMEERLIEKIVDAETGILNAFGPYETRMEAV